MNNKIRQYAVAVFAYACVALVGVTAYGQNQTLNQPALTANDANVVFTDIGGGIVQVTFNGVFDFSAMGGSAESYSGTFLYDTSVPPISVDTTNPGVTIANYLWSGGTFSIFGSTVTPLFVFAQIHDGSGIYNDLVNFQVALDANNNFGLPIPGTATGLIDIGINANAFPGIMLTSAAFPRNLDVFSSANLGVNQFVVVPSEGFAATQILVASELVADLGRSQVTTKGNQRAFLNFLNQALAAIHAGDFATAIHKLQSAIARTDGCPLRNSRDVNGPSRDWITDCNAQAQVYDLLNQALDVLIP